MPNIAAFISYVLVTTFTPGPNNIMAMSNASRYGFKKSIMFNLGAFSGFFIIIALSNIFTVTLYSLIPSIKPVMTYIGAAYILWLAWKIYNSKPHNDTKGQKRTNTYFAGLLLQFVNPKAIIYAVTLVSTFIVPYYKSVPVLAAFSISLAFVGFLSTCSWALLGSAFNKFLVKNDRVVNTVMSLLLAYCAVSLFL
jgi:threonine/homoserine/homoserine lactone efflux protein